MPKTKALVTTKTTVGAVAAPSMIARAGAAAEYAWDEFVSGQIRNRHTRLAYVLAIRRFLNWISPIESDVARITPGMVGRYFDELDVAVPTKKLHLSAIRRFFDVLTQRHVVLINPALSVRTERYSVVEGRTPEITTAQARALLNSFSVEKSIDFRDRAVIATLIFTAARAGAIARLKIKDWKDEAGQTVLCFNEKGGKQRRIPVRHDLQTILGDYLDVFAINRKAAEASLFRTIRDDLLTDRGMTGGDICRMVKRRLKTAGLPGEISPHSFRSCAATDLLKQGVPLEDVQHLLGHSDARVTRLYDRRQRVVTRNIVERISV